MPRWCLQPDRRPQAPIEEVSYIVNSWQQHQYGCKAQSKTYFRNPPFKDHYYWQMCNFNKSILKSAEATQQMWNPTYSKMQCINVSGWTSSIFTFSVINLEWNYNISLPVDCHLWASPCLIACVWEGREKGFRGTQSQWALLGPRLSGSPESEQ